MNAPVGMGLRKDFRRRGITTPRAGAAALGTEDFADAGGRN